MAMIFPLDSKKVDWSSEVAESWEIQEQNAASGKRRTQTYQSLPGWTFKLKFPVLTKAERDTLFAFYAQCKGPFGDFFYKDAESYLIEKQRLGKNSDGSYQLVAKLDGYIEPVAYADHLMVYVNGVKQASSAYTLNNGAIVFKTAPSGTVTASYEYYWKCCFDKSKITEKQLFIDMFSVELTLRVVR